MSINHIPFLVWGGVAFLVGLILLIVNGYKMGKEDVDLDPLDCVLFFAVGAVWPIILLLAVLVLPVYGIGRLAHMFGRASRLSEMEPLGSHPTARRIE